MTGFGLLGPLRAERDGAEIAIGAAKLRVLLCALLVEPNRVVSLDELCARVWETGAPGLARSTLQSYVMRLRRLLGADELIETHPGGYLIRVAEDELDIVAFGRLVDRGTRLASDEPEMAVALLREALALWRGEPLADVPSEGLRAMVVPALTERYLTATEQCVELELRLDRPGTVLPELAELTARYPLRERFWAQRMRALHAIGRPDEALDCYRELSRILADELGTTPTERLHQLREAVVAGTVPAEAPVSRGTPNSLPADKVDFTGRTHERDVLLDIDPSPVRVIDGMAGIGKTTFAVHVAHELNAAYPDAALFIDLHAHSDRYPPMAPADALDALLRMLGVPSQQIPESLDERAARWRAELAGRKALLVLDNASEAAQVRPLLPGSPDCLVLITSRRRLAALDGAKGLSLDTLPPEDALTLFTGMVGAERVRAEPEATGELLGRCGYLPLAIRIVGARLRARSSWSIVDMLGRLADRPRRSGELVTGDRSVSAAFALSYRQLAEPERRLFRLLGLYPGPDLDGRLAAALAGVDLDTAEATLEGLVDAHLLEPVGPDRYRFHDLLRDHARELAERTDSAAERIAAINRAVRAEPG
ncbi:MAG TPA: BTAD domain-containing putative transcriptional regulator [Pseudonocardiaceae bacterium]